MKIEQDEFNMSTAWVALCSLLGIHTNQLNSFFLPFGQNINPQGIIFIPSSQKLKFLEY